MLGLDSSSTEGIGSEIATACYPIFSDLKEGRKAAESERCRWLDLGPRQWVGAIQGQHEMQRVLRLLGHQEGEGP